MDHKPTSEQAAIFEAFKSSEPGHLRINAGAGCGKTSTSTKGLAWSPTHPMQTLCFSFAKRDAIAFEAVVPAGTVCKTSNGLGHSATMKMLGGKVTLNKDKLYQIASEHEELEKWSEIERRQAVVKLAGAAFTAGIIPETVKKFGLKFKPLAVDHVDSYAALADHYDINILQHDFALVRDVMHTSMQRAIQHKEISFDDQIIFPACFGAPLPKFKEILVDEAQDLDPLRHVILQKALASGGRLIQVGDPNQAIYGFRGALNNSMDLLAEKFPPLHDLPLMTTFRCPKAIVRQANKIVPQLVAAPGNIEGEVQRHTSWELEQIPDGALVLCRNNGPLVALAFNLIRHRRSAMIQGRDIGKGLSTLVIKLQKGKTKTIPSADLLKRLQDWKDAEIEKFPKRAGRIDDRAACIKVLAESCKNSSEVLQVITKIFDARNASINLSTIHRAKGSEAHTVVLLDRWLIGQRAEEGTWQMQQEKNLRYVADTRAQHTLMYLNSNQCLDD